MKHRARKRRKTWLWLVAIAALAALAAGALSSSVALTVRLPRQGGRLIAAARIDRDDAVVRIAYRHSVELSRVEGLFKIGPGPRLLAYQTRMESTGTGLPNVDPERTRREGEWLVVEEGLKPIPGFRFFLMPINRLRIFAGDEELPIDEAQAGDILYIGVERVRFWRWLAWRALGRPWPVPSAP